MSGMSVSQGVAQPGGEGLPEARFGKARCIGAETASQGLVEVKWRRGDR